MKTIDELVQEQITYFENKIEEARIRAMTKILKTYNPVTRKDIKNRLISEVAELRKELAGAKYLRDNPHAYFIPGDVGGGITFTPASTAMLKYIS